MMGQFLICIYFNTDSYKINSQFWFETLLRQITKLKMCSRKELIDKF